jgi:prevent-host-death family protein
MEITATELKQNLGKYIDEAAHGDVVITKNGKAVARLVGESEYQTGASELDNLLMLREASVADVYSPGAVPGIPLGGAGAAPGQGIDIGLGEWVLTYNGENVARLTPIPKKKKRRLGFMKSPGEGPGEVNALSESEWEKEDAALFESEWTEKDEAEWLNKL